MVAERPAARLEHASKGRLRARVVRPQRSSAVMEEVRARVAAHPGVRHVEVNRTTGSVLVQGETDRIRDALDGALTLVRSLESGEAADRGVDQVVGLVRTVDGRLREVTAGRLSLRWLVPATFVTVGLRQLLQEGLTVGAVPWYVLLYYGVDSFLKLYPEHTPRP